MVSQGYREVFKSSSDIALFPRHRTASARQRRMRIPDSINHVSISTPIRLEVDLNEKLVLKGLEF